MRETLARKLRSSPTEAEKRLWRLLFPFRTGGFHFRKQAVIGPYVVDFVCHHARLVIEVDGGQHWTAEGMGRDDTSDLYLRRRGYDVIRISNLDVLGNSDGVAQMLANALSGRQLSTTARAD